jgi:site-specific DNA-methyltransferase (adenine-specific)
MKKRRKSTKHRVMITETKTLSLVGQKPYFAKDNFVLYNANCLEILAQMPENSVDMIFADPPYNLSNGGISVHAGRMVSVNKGDWDKSKGFEDDYDFHYKWMEACKRVLKPQGSLWVSGTYHSIYQCGHALQSLGYHILNDIAWFKPNASPNLSCRFFTASHETLIWARKDKKAKHTFNYDLMKNGKWPEDFLKKDGLQMRSVWSILTPRKSEKKFGKHPTQKPIDLLKRIVLASTKEGDVVLDPFTGSSTTGIAASAFKRQFIGIDLEKKYLDLSIKRHNEIEELIDELNKVHKNITPEQVKILANKLAVKQAELF